MRKVKAAAAREATDAKRRKEAEEGQLNPMRRHSRAVRSTSRSRGRRAVHGARRARRRSNVAQADADPGINLRARSPLPSTHATPASKEAASGRRLTSTPVGLLNTATRRASFVPRPSQQAVQPIFSTVKARRAARAGRRQSTFVMSVNPLVQHPKQSSVAAAAAAGSRARGAALRGRRQRRPAAHGYPVLDSHGVAEPGVHIGAQPRGDTGTVTDPHS